MPDKIDETLGIGPMHALPSIEVLDPKPTETNKVDAEDDNEYARRNLRDLIEHGKDVLQTLTDIATSSESPRAFEALNGLMEKMIGANETLIDIGGKKKTAADEQKNPGGVINHTQNIIIAGTADEVLKAVRKARGERDIEDEMER